MNTTQQPAPRFTAGQRVRIIANAGGLYSAQIGVVGVIARKRQYRRWGYHTYDVDYQDAKGREKRLTSVRDDDLAAVKTEAPVEQTPPEQTATPAKPEKAPETPPRFAKGDRVTVDSRSALCYETFTRKGAVGVIMHADKPVRGIRRYQVLFEVPHLGGRRASRIREEHLLAAEAPAPRPTTTLRHAHEYRDEKPRGAHLWCDAGGCFIEACAICRAYLGDTLTVPPVERADEPMPTPTPVVCDHDWYAIPADDGKPRLRRCRLCGGVGVGCAHDWQVWPDGRYRHCPKCKLSERVPAAVLSPALSAMRESETPR